MSSIHQFKVKGIDGSQIDFGDFSGKKILVVNVASACGYTPQYRLLEELYREFESSLVVVGVPCNDFGNQEPQSEADIQAFCSSHYDVTFPMTAKVNIKREPIHPLYDWLTQKAKNNVADSEVTWNFQKYLLDESGTLLEHFAPSVLPADEKILELLVEE